MKSFFNKYIKTIFKTEHSRFVMLTGLKVSGISILINLVVYGFLFEMMRLNYAFFKANNLDFEILKEKENDLVIIIE